MRTTRKSHEHITITVGARRSCHFYPADPVGIGTTLPKLYKETSEDHAARVASYVDAVHGPARAKQRAAQLEIDAAIYHAPLDSAPARKRKAPAKLATSAKCGERAMAADDHKACKRPVAVAIGYTSAGGEYVVAIFGGLTSTQASEAISERDGQIISGDDADRYADGDRFAVRPSSRSAAALVGRRVVIWPSETHRRIGARAFCNVTEIAAQIAARYPEQAALLAA